MSDVPKHYTLIHDNDDHFVVHDGKDNRAFSVAKKGIHPATQMKIMKLKKYNEGGLEDGEPEEESVAAPVESAPPPPVAVPATDFNFVPNLSSAPPVQSLPNWHAPMASPEAVAQQVAENQISVPEGQAPPDILAGLPGMELAKKGLEGQFGSQANYARDQQAALGAYQKNMDDLALQHKNTFERLDREQADYQKLLLDGKVDPKRYFNDMGTGKRVKTAIALILGGIGAGLTRGPNLALQLIDKAVDNDIAAQKAELGKTETLLNLNMRKYGNAQAAEAATRLQYNTALQTQLQAAQAKATSGAAAAHLNLGLANLQQQAVQLRMSIAQKMGQMHSLGAGTGEGGIPEGQEPASLLLDPKYRESRVVVNGRAYQANDNKSAGTVRDMQSLAGPIIDGVKELAELAHDPSTRFAGSPSNLRAHAIMGDLSVKLPLISGATIGAKRINSEEIAHQVERFQNPTRFDQALGGIKNDQLFKSLEKEIEDVRTQHLVGYKGMGKIKSFSPLVGGGKLPRNQ